MWYGHAPMYVCTYVLVHLDAYVHYIIMYVANYELFVKPTPSYCHEKPPFRHKSIIDDSHKFIEDHNTLT